MKVLATCKVLQGRTAQSSVFLTKHPGCSFFVVAEQAKLDSDSWKCVHPVKETLLTVLIL